jgi:hypothetical protein
MGAIFGFKINGSHNFLSVGQLDEAICARAMVLTLNGLGFGMQGLFCCNMPY